MGGCGGGEGCVAARAVTVTGQIWLQVCDRLVAVVEVCNLVAPEQSLRALEKATALNRPIGQGEYPRKAGNGLINA